MTNATEEETLLKLKFGSVSEGISALGSVPVARRQTFKDSQRRLYLTTA